ncbi:MAG: VWA domain-containing protein [Crocinitomicaceae bacterium]|nr:VWA domain-containing protein [Crocinitomicaceae bacterium]
MRTLFICIFILTCLNSEAQVIAPKNSQVFSFEMKVTTLQGGLDVGRDIVFIESETYERVSIKTDAQGMIKTTFDHGVLWLGSVGEMRNCFEVNAAWGGNSTRQMTYDPVGWERANKPLPDRRTIQFSTVDQSRLTPTTKPSERESVLSIILLDQHKKVYSRVPVSLVCFETKQIYKSKTNANGSVTFKIPISQNYEIDIDGVESLKFIDFDKRPMVTTMRIMYQPRMFTEDKNDRFITQNLPADVEPCSSHARIKLKVRKGWGQAINEDVYVRMLQSNTVYKAKTNDQGEVTFMLPIRNNYQVDFQYQRDAGNIDLSKVNGIGFKEEVVEYIVDPRLADIESFIPSVRDLVEYDIHSFVQKQYPEPTNNDIEFYCSWGQKFNEHSKESLLEVGLKVRSKTKRKSKEPLNICFVIDKSGSMSGDRITQLKRSLLEFVQQLDAKDMVSIIVFDSDAVLAVPATLVGDKKKIIDVIHAIRAGGGTNIHEGLIKGFLEVKKLRAETSINRLILLTDGYGSTPPEQVIAAAKAQIKGGIELSAVGVGIDYNQALLSQLASAGGGLLHLAGSSSHIQEVFQHELESIVYPMAKKATLTVEYNNKIVYRQLYGYTNEVVTKGQMKLEIPNLFPGLNQMALMKFDLIDPTRAITKEPVIVTLTYTDAVTGKPVELKKRVHPEWTDATGELDMTIDMEHKKVLAVAVANQSMKVMANAFENGDKAASQKAIESAINQISNIFPKAKPKELLAIIDRLQQYVDAFETLKEVTIYEGE